ncbi:MAG: hypothetical protein ACYTEV_10535, partial [Planctomycetota bacterium]
SCSGLDQILVLRSMIMATTDSGLRQGAGSCVRIRAARRDPVSTVYRSGEAIPWIGTNLE